jgi:hypothetical protein
MYCFKCKKATPTLGGKLTKTSNNRLLLNGKCRVCSGNKAQFQSAQKKRRGKGLLNKMINKLPVELHLPGYNYCGPGTKLQKRLARGDVGINSLDEACKNHDMAYDAESNLNHRHIADKKLATEALKVMKSRAPNFKEKLAALAVASAMKAKLKLRI